MNIKILADRMIDLSDEERQQLGIDTISCFVNMGGESYSDMEDVFPDDIFAYMDRTGNVAQTAARSPDMYADFFEKYINEGFTVIHFAVSSGISSIFTNAAQAASRFPGRAYVIDTRLLSNGIALLARYALSLIASGETDPEAIVKKTTLRIPSIQCSFLIDSLECLYRGGRSAVRHICLAVF